MMRSICNFLKYFYLCLLLIISPNKFSLEASKHDQTNNSRKNESRTLIVRRAFWMSFCIVSIAAIIGAFAGVVIRRFFGPLNGTYVSYLQAAGAMILLWGTLFVRGWEIQSIGGSTLLEKANSYIYRAMYCIGTMILVMSLSVA